MATDLSDNATTEEINEYVDQVVKDVEADRAGEQVGDKTDSQRVAEDTEEVTAGTGLDSEDSEDTASDGEDAGDSEGQDWLDDDLKAEIAAYGIDEQEIADFTNREEVERALRFFDRSALEAGRKAMAERDKESSTEEAARDKRGRFAKDESKEEESKDAEPKGFEINLDKDVYDEGLVDEFTRLRDHYESRLSVLEERVVASDARHAEIAANEEEKLFDSIVDTLGHSDLFGKAGKENTKQLERRKDLYIEAKALQIGRNELGRAVDIDEALVGRVAKMVFAEDISKKELKARTRKVSKQSSGRMGVSDTKSRGPEQSVLEEMEQLYKELDAH